MNTEDNTKENKSTKQAKQAKPRGKNAGKYFLRSNGARMNERNLPRVTTKNKKLVKTFIETGSPTKAGLSAYDTKDKGVARSIFYETMKKPHVQSYMQSLLDKHISDDELIGIHVRNIKQEENLAVSQKAVESFEVMKGLTAKEQEDRGNVTVNIIQMFNEKEE